MPQTRPESLTMPASITNAYSPAVVGVPEPGSPVPAGIGLIGLGWFGRKGKEKR
jgi:hypothetical protein